MILIFSIIIQMVVCHDRNLVMMVCFFLSFENGRVRKNE